MYVKIIQTKISDCYTVEFGYEMPDVITDKDQIPQLDVKLLYKNPEDLGACVDVDSTEYKQMLATAHCLKAGFEIGCSYTQRLFAQMAERAAANEEAVPTEKISTQTEPKPILV